MTGSFVHVIVGLLSKSNAYGRKFEIFKIFPARTQKDFAKAMLYFLITAFAIGKCPSNFL